MINRAAVILTCKEPFGSWLDTVASREGLDVPTLAELNRDATVYLITDDDAEQLDEWIALNHTALFESELEDWCADETLWPPERTLQVFQEWFEVVCHTIICDTVGTPIVDEES